MEKPLSTISLPMNAPAVKAEAAQRIAWMDMAKGLLLLLVVYLHYPNSNTALDRTFVGTIVMPCFFILSGILSKWRTPSETLRRETKSLLVPYLGLSVLGIFVTAVTKGIYYSWDCMPYTVIPHLKAMLSGCGLPYPDTTSSPLWFLFSLFEVRVVFSLSYRCGMMRSAFTWFVISFSYLLLIGPNEGHILPRSFLDTFMICIGCYSIGVLASPIKKLKIPTRHLWPAVLVGIALVALAIYAILPPAYVFDPLGGRNLIGIQNAYLVIIPTAATIIGISMLADRYDTGAAGRFLRQISIAALAILTFHQTVLVLQQLVLMRVMPGHAAEWYVGAFFTVADVAFLTWIGLRLRRRWPKLFGPR